MGSATYEIEQIRLKLFHIKFQKVYELNFLQIKR